MKHAKSGPADLKEPPGRIDFTAKLYETVEGKSWTYADLPGNSGELLGSADRVQVKGTINGFFFRSSVIPTGSGSHQLMVNRTMRLGSKTKAGDVVRIVLERDATQRGLRVPEDLSEALRAHPEARSRWDAFPYAHRKQYVDWIEQAAEPGGRRERIEKAVALIAIGKSLS